jgi:hypothetical protein
MKSFFRIFVASLVVAAPLGTAFADDSGKSVTLAKSLIGSFTKGNKGDAWPHIGPMPRWSINIDTFTQEVSSRVIGELYAMTCKKVEEHYKAEMKTYTWVDQMGWPRLATVVQFKIEDRPTSFLLVTAFQNNDNDSYSLSYEDGEFSITDKKLAPSWELPKGHLREDTK